MRRKDVRIAWPRCRDSELDNGSRAAPIEGRKGSEESIKGAGGQDLC